MSIGLSIYLVMITVSSGLLLGWAFGSWLAYHRAMTPEAMNFDVSRPRDPVDNFMSKLQSAEDLMRPGIEAMSPSRRGQVIVARAQLTGRTLEKCHDEEVNFLANVLEMEDVKTIDLNGPAELLSIADMPAMSASRSDAIVPNPDAIQ